MRFLGTMGILGILGIVGILGILGIGSCVTPRCRYSARCTALQFNDARASPYSLLYPYSPASPSSAQIKLMRSIPYFSVFSFQFSVYIKRCFLLISHY